MAIRHYDADVVIVGAGLAGIVAALELLEGGRRVLLLDRSGRDRLGGLARESFGGIFMVGTPQQRRSGIADSPDLALRDWLSFAELAPEDEWPRRWAERYVRDSIEGLYSWLTARGVRFFPVVHWVERGLFVPGNSVPRFHMVWGTGSRLVEVLTARLAGPRLDVQCGHAVTGIESTNGRAVGVVGRIEATGEDFTASGDVVIAAGGICGGDLTMARRHWYAPWGKAPDNLLNGSHEFADGTVHDAAAAIGAKLTHLDRMWHYAAGVHHPRPARSNHGLSLVPPKSALWVDCHGRRIGPVPLVTGYDTRFLVESILRQPRQYSWQVLNWKIAVRELAISGSEYNDAIRDRRLLAFLKSVLLGNPRLVRDLVSTCPDFVTAQTVPELAAKMNELTGEPLVDAELLGSEIRRYDENIARGPRFYNDDQLRRIAQARQYKGDRLRTCRFQRIYDAAALPLIAIREFILTRKSLGGLQTDLSSQVLNAEGRAIPGLYAVGEAAGFGGGGIHGLRALEGTFLGSCVLTARAAARSLLGKEGTP